MVFNWIWYKFTSIQRNSRISVSFNKFFKNIVKIYILNIELYKLFKADA